MVLRTKWLDYDVHNLSIFPWGGASHCAPGSNFCPKYNETEDQATSILGNWYPAKISLSEEMTLNV